jgi:hypothetical protein
MQEIKGIARVKFLPGKVEEWKRLTERRWRLGGYRHRFRPILTSRISLAPS